MHILRLKSTLNRTEFLGTQQVGQVTYLLLFSGIEKKGLLLNLCIALQNREVALLCGIVIIIIVVIVVAVVIVIDVLSRILIR